MKWSKREVEKSLPPHSLRQPSKAFSHPDPTQITRNPASPRALLLDTHPPQAQNALVFPQAGSRSEATPAFGKH